MMLLFGLKRRTEPGRGRKTAMPDTSDIPAPERSGGELTVAECAANLRAARSGIKACERLYEDVRKGSKVTAITRARSEWGLALFSWAEALVAHEAAKDRRNIAARLDRQEDAMRARPAPGGRTRAEELAHASRERDRSEAAKPARPPYHYPARPPRP